MGLYFNAGFRVRTTVVVIAGVFLQVTVVVLLLLGYWGDHVDFGDPTAFGRVRRLPTVGWALYRFLSLLSPPSHGNYF